MEFPIIDIAGIDSPDHQAKVANKITEASQTWGFLLIKNHGIPAAQIDEMFALARSFFIHEDEDSKTPWPINERSIGYSRALTDKFGDDKASM